jgi:hypothetical protein
MDLPLTARTPLALQLITNGVPLDLLADVAWPTPSETTDFTPTAPPC